MSVLKRIDNFNLLLLVTMEMLLTASLVYAGGRKVMGKPREKLPEGLVEEVLLKRLLYNYDTDARGVVDPNQTVNVTLSLLLIRIQGLDERSQVLTTTGLIICDWKDERLVWDPQDYNNITDIVVRPERIWLPELALMNGADELAPDFLRIRALLSHDGHVHWEPGSIFTTTCDIDIRYFPFDEQICPIQIGAWAYYSARMNIVNNSDEIHTKDFRLNGEWEVLSTKSEGKIIILPCCPDTHYPYVEFTLHLRRRYTFYMMNIILPCSLLSVLVMVVFCLPPDAGEKISLGISVLLAFTVFLLMVAENVPRTSLHIPVMVLYLTGTEIVSTFSVIISVLVLDIHFRDAEVPVPSWLRILCFKYLARFLCVSGRKPKTFAKIEERMEFESRVNSPQSAIRRLAQFTPVMTSVVLHSNGNIPGEIKTEVKSHHGHRNKHSESGKHKLGRKYQSILSDDEDHSNFKRTNSNSYSNGDCNNCNHGNIRHSNSDCYNGNQGNLNYSNSDYNNGNQVRFNHSNNNGNNSSHGDINHGYNNHRLHRRQDSVFYDSLDDVRLTPAEKRRRRSNCYEWREIAHILDRLFFVIVLTFTVITFVAFMLAPVYKAPYKVYQM